MTDRNPLLQNITIKDSFKNLSNCIFYLRKEDFNLNIEWAKNNIEISLKSIGTRYITYNDYKFSNLNIEIDIQSIFNFITDTNNNFKYHEFYSFLKNNNYDDAIHYSEGIGVKYHLKKLEQPITQIKEYKNKELIFKNKINDEMEYTECIYYNFLEEIKILLSFYSSYSDLLEKFSSINIMKSNFFNKSTIALLNRIENIYSQIKNKNTMKLIDNYMGPGNGSYAVEKIYKLKRRAKWLYEQNIIELKKFIIEKKISSKNKINENNILSTFLFKYTLIVGEAMSGKTHLLSDIAKRRINQNNPTILIYAQKFNEDLVSPIQHCINQLGLEKYQFTDDEFLSLVNEWGKKSNELVFFIIDAINETKNKNIWSNYFIEFVSKIMTYSYISLLMSVRDVEKKIIFTDNIQRFVKSNMIEVKHRGFEKIEYPVLKKFCTAFEIKLPTFPFTSQIFSNPGLLFLFFETLKRNNVQVIDEKILKPNFIINEYIKDRNKHFKELHNISDRRTFIVRATNKISSEIVSSGFIEDVKYDDIYDELLKIHEYILDYLISEGILLENTNQFEETLLYFSYQRFGNYFIAIYLLMDNFSNMPIPNKKILYNLFSNYEQHQSLIEALIIWLSENKELDFIDIFPELFVDEKLNNIRYKCFSQSISLPATIKDKVNTLLSLDFYEQSKILEILLKTSHEQSNNFNIQLTLHPLLMSLDLLNRESIWAIYINNSFTSEGVVQVIINWALEKEKDFDIEYNSLFLYGMTLGWFLCSSNRELRDKTTKALVNIFTDNIACFLDILKEFSSVNDLYITERLYAVAYGITLRSNSQKGYKELAEYIYNNIFNVDNVLEHIMIRDYAKLTVEYIYVLLELDIEIEKVKPPYNSVLPNILPSDEEIDSYENKYIEIDRIISSMLTESGRSGRFGYGDFGRYTFQSNLRNFKLKNLRIQDLSNYAVKMIIDEMIVDKELFSQVESNLKNISHSRSEHKIERIGKKYQWLALYKILAIVADNFKVKDLSSWNDENVIEYKGTSQLSCRNIDPTSILRNKIESEYQWWLDINNDFENLELPDIEWMKSSEKLPIVSQIVDINFENNKYLLLDTSFSIDSNKQNDKYRNLYYHINSFILKKEDLDTFVSWAKDQVFYAKKMPESNSFYSVFLREYPFSETYDLINNYYNSQMNWETTFDDRDKGLPCEVLLTSTSYMNEASGYDNSVDNAINIILPNKWIVENMNLKQSLNDGEWIDVNKNIIFIDKGTNNEDGALLANKEKLLEFLDNNGYTICWIMWGEKQVRNSNNKFDDEDFLGISEIDSFSYFDGTTIIDNKINIKYK